MNIKTNLEKFFKRAFFYGLNKDSFLEILPSIREENNKMMGILAIIMTILGWTTTVLSYFDFILDRKGLPIYLFLYIASTILLLIRRYIKIGTGRLAHGLGIVQLLIIHMFAILLSTYYASSPNINGVIYQITLLSTPFVFIATPVEMDAILCISTTYYLYMAKFFKADVTLNYDRLFVYMILFIAVMCNWFYAVKSIKNIRNRKYIEKERDTDALTGLLTKQAGKSLTINKLDNDEEGVLFIIDMDNFKIINDTQGHLYGDNILIRLSNIIKENTRRKDVVARFGGDEFVIFFPEMKMDEIDIKAEDILKLVKKNFKKEKFKVSCSIGAAVAKKGTDYNKLFDSADKALYKAKELGKNTFFYEQAENA